MMIGGFGLFLEPGGLPLGLLTSSIVSPSFRLFFLLLGSVGGLRLRSRLLVLLRLSASSEVVLLRLKWWFVMAKGGGVWWWWCWYLENMVSLSSRYSPFIFFGFF